MQVYSITATALISSSRGAVIDVHVNWVRTASKEHAKVMFREVYPELNQYDLTISEAPEWVYTTPRPEHKKQI